MRRIIVAAAFTVAVCGCAEDEPASVTGKKFTVSAHIESRRSADGYVSRTSMDADGSMSWSAGSDRIGILAVADGGDALEGNYRFDISDAAAGTFTGPALPQADAYKAYYPYGALALNGGEVTFNLPATQSQAVSGGSGDVLSACDFLYSAAVPIDAGSGQGRVAFSHAFSLVRFEITATGFAQGDRITGISLSDASAWPFFTRAALTASQTVPSFSMPVNSISLSVSAPDGHDLTSGGGVYEGWMLAACRSDARISDLRLHVNTTAGDISMGLPAPSDGYFIPGRRYAIARTVDLGALCGVIWSENVGVDGVIGENIGVGEFGDAGLFTRGGHSGAGASYAASGQTVYAGIANPSSARPGDANIFFGGGLSTPEQTFTAGNIALKGASCVKLLFDSYCGEGTFKYANLKAFYAFGQNPSAGDWVALPFERANTNATTWLPITPYEIDTSGQSWISLRWQAALGAGGKYRIDNMRLVTSL